MAFITDWQFSRYLTPYPSPIIQALTLFYLLYVTLAHCSSYREWLCYKDYREAERMDDITGSELSEKKIKRILTYKW